MFNGLDFKNLGGFMKNFQEMNEKIEKVKEDLVGITATGKGGIDQVLVTVDGGNTIVDITIHPDLMKNGNISMLQDYIKAATNNALAEVSAEKEKRMQEIMAKLGLPPGFKFPF